MSEQLFRFVPPFVIDMAREALDYLPDLALANIIKQGSFSAYELVFNQGDTEHRCRIGYDFGLTLVPAARGLALAKHVAEKCGLELSVPETPAEPITDEQAAELPPAELTVIGEIEITAEEAPAPQAVTVELVSVDVQPPAATELTNEQRMQIEEAVAELVQPATTGGGYELPEPMATEMETAMTEGRSLAAEIPLAPSKLEEIIAAKSFARLDEIGISAAAVRKRIKKLMKDGTGEDDAFRTAVMEQVEKQ